MSPLALVPDASGKVTITHIASGAAFQRFPVDAREMLASGEYVLGTTEAITPTVVTDEGAEGGSHSVAPVGSVPPLPEDLPSRTKAELAQFAAVELQLTLNPDDLNKSAMLERIADAHALLLAALVPAST